VIKYLKLGLRAFFLKKIRAPGKDFFKKTYRFMEPKNKIKIHKITIINTLKMVK
jgi:hypothetical protein